jgi:hypothetical protein
MRLGGALVPHRLTPHWPVWGRIPSGSGSSTTLMSAATTTRYPGEAMASAVPPINRRYSSATGFTRLGLLGDEHPGDVQALGDADQQVVVCRLRPGDLVGVAVSP